MQYYMLKNDRNFDSQKRKLKRKYERYLNGLDLSGIEHSINIDCVSKNLLNDDSSQCEYEDYIENKHLFFGIVVLFKKANKINGSANLIFIT